VRLTLIHVRIGWALLRKAHDKASEGGAQQEEDCHQPAIAQRLDVHHPVSRRPSATGGPEAAAGTVAMMISGPWAWDNVRKVGIDFTVAPLPSVGGKPSRPFVGVLGCMITAPSKVKDIAREFLENHLLRIEGLKTVSADVPLGTPANKAYFAELAGDPHIRATMDNARAGEPIPNIPETGRFFPAMDAALEALSQGRQSPKDALDGAAARMKAK
jgi:maltose/maltodextrin transport system substrate-binding protein